MRRISDQAIAQRTRVASAGRYPQVAEDIIATIVSYAASVDLDLNNVIRITVVLPA